MKRLISLALVAVMTITMVPFAALSVFAVDPALESSAMELVGTAPSDPMVKTEFDSDGYVAGGKLTVKITVTALKQSGVVGYEADSLIYDSSKLTLANTKSSSGMLDCITASPGREWVSENFTTADVDGEVLLSSMGGIQYADQTLTPDKTLEFTLKFNVAEDVSGDLIIYIPHSAISVAEAETMTPGSGLGGYIIISENTSGDVSEDESDDVSEDISDDASEEVSEDYSEDVSDEPYIPSDKEDDVLALMGTAPANPLAKIKISAPRYIDGEVLEVTVSVYDIIEGGLNSFSIENFTYDATKLVLLTETNSTGALECITKCPGSDWTSDNFSKVESEGVLTLAALGGLMDDSQILRNDYGLVFTLHFQVLEGTTDELVFYAPHESVLASVANDIYPMPCESDYLIVHHKCALGHTESEFDCEVGQICTVCGDVLTPALGHIAGADADCENDQTCTVCGDVLTPALGHTAGAEADCENDQTCTVCGEVLNTALGHDYDAVVTKPDCENGGYTTHTCANCGDTYTDNATDALGHDYDAVVTKPDCENGGYTTHTCANCGDTYTDNATDALGHDYDAVVTKPDCNNGGYTTHTCVNCGDAYTDSEVPALGHTAGAEADCENDQTCTVCGEVLNTALGHDYDAVVTEPDCENGGYTTHTCANCGDSYNDSEVPALGHTAGSSADCENDEVCTVCGTLLNEALGHDYDAVVTKPDCNNGGYTTHTCKNCGDTYTDSEVPALGHTAGAEADCENDQTCTVCGEVLNTALGHDYDAVVTEPDCENGGYTTHTCANCGDTYTDSEVPALGHTAGADADCENDQTCTVCGTVLDEALGHDYDAVVTKPDCENGGYTTHTCVNCGDAYTDSEVPSLGHDYDAVVTEPDCENGGYTTHTCANCGDTYTDSEVPALGHTAGAEADCENDQTCTVCGDVLTPSLGHDYDAVVTEPDCENGGYTTHTCANCGDTYTDSEVPALGHTAGAEADCENDQTCTVCGEVLNTALGHDYDAVVTEPDCENGGYTTHTCANCGDTYTDSETEPRGHGDGEWVTLENNDKELRCEHCGEVLAVDLWCDVNQDGRVNMFDYVLVKSIYFEKQEAPDVQKQRADITGDGKVNMFDYIIVKNRVLAK